MKSMIAVLTLGLLASPAFAAKSCDELKSEIEAKIRANGVENFSLEIVPKGQTGDAKVVGSCGGGTQEIAYKRL